MRHEQNVTCMSIYKRVLGELPLEKCRIKFVKPVSYDKHCKKRLHPKLFNNCEEFTNFPNNSPPCTALINLITSCKHELTIPCNLEGKFKVNEWSLGPCQLCPDTCITCLEKVSRETAYSCHEEYICVQCLKLYISDANDDIKKDDFTPSEFITD
jgi:hypothetical protein